LEFIHLLKIIVVDISNGFSLHFIVALKHTFLEDMSTLVNC